MPYFQLVLIKNTKSMHSIQLLFGYLFIFNVLFFIFDSIFFIFDFLLIFFIFDYIFLIFVIILFFFIFDFLFFFHLRRSFLLYLVINKIETKKDDDYECTTRIFGDKWEVSQENFVHSNKKFFYASRVCIQDACNMQTKLTILKDSFSGKYSPDYRKQL